MAPRSLPNRWTITLAALVAVGAGCSRDEQSPPAADESIAPAESTVVTTPATVAPTTAVPTTAAPTTAAPTTVPPTTVRPTTVPPTTVAPTTAPPTSVAHAAEPVDRVVTVHSGRTPIGVWDGAGWRYPEWGADLLPSLTAASPDLVLTGLDLPEPVAGASLGPLDYFCVGDEQAPSVEMPDGFDAGERRFIAVTADWNVQPRPVQQVGLANPEYAAVGAALVDPDSGADPAAGEVRQVVRADLDGDGVEEVLVTYANQTTDAPFGTAGDYTLIIARYPHTDGTVDDVVLWSYYEQPVDFPDPADASIVAVADLNGDSVMEVVIEAMAWEQSAISVLGLVDRHLAVVSGGGCGV